MRRFLPYLALALMLVAGCSDDDCPTCPQTTDPPETAAVAFEELANWWATDADVDLSAHGTAIITVTVRNDAAEGLDIGGEFPQIWTVPDAYGFQDGVDAEVLFRPTGITPPGGTDIFCIALDLSEVPADQVRIALRPWGAPLGNLMPSRGTITGGVVFSP